MKKVEVIFKLEASCREIPSVKTTYHVAGLHCKITLPNHPQG